MFEWLSEQVVAIYKEMKDPFGLEMTKTIAKVALSSRTDSDKGISAVQQDSNNSPSTACTETIRQPLLVNHNSSSENHDLPTRSTSFICSHVCFPGIQSTNPFRILIWSNLYHNLGSHQIQRLLLSCKQSSERNSRQERGIACNTITFNTMLNGLARQWP